MKTLYLAEAISRTATGWHRNCIDMNVVKVTRANKHNDANTQMELSYGFCGLNMPQIYFDAQNAFWTWN